MTQIAISQQNLTTQETEIENFLLQKFRDEFYDCTGVKDFIKERIYWHRPYKSEISYPYLKLAKEELACPNTADKNNLYYSNEFKFLIPLPRGINPIELATRYEIADGQLHQDSKSIAGENHCIVISSPLMNATYAEILMQSLGQGQYKSLDQAQSLILKCLDLAEQLGFLNVFPIPKVRATQLYEQIYENQDNSIPALGLHYVKIPRAVSFLPTAVAIDQTRTAGATIDGAENFIVQEKTVFIFKLTEDLQPSFNLGIPDIDTYDADQFLQSYVNVNKELPVLDDLPNLLLLGSLENKPNLLKVVSDIINQAHLFK